MKILKNLLYFVSCLILLSGCMAININNYKDQKPNFDLMEYFNGSLKAWGIIQDWRGNVVSRFDITMQGDWQGDICKLYEEFKFYSGKTQTRTWTITKLADGNYSGVADDIIGKATGKTVGNAAKWQYVMDVPVDGSTYRIKFDDWMWQMNDGIAVNRSYMKKFGFTVAEITIFIQKQ
ncbi:MAG: DUF3833 domain-containing protein [Rickettsiaceae bacterium]|nr:DUF3833 domain-containing protein [Rickettsiaceae bacterium]